MSSDKKTVTGTVPVTGIRLQIELKSRLNMN